MKAQGPDSSTAIQQYRAHDIYLPVFVEDSIRTGSAGTTRIAGPAELCEQSGQAVNTSTNDKGIGLQCIQRVGCCILILERNGAHHIVGRNVRKRPDGNLQ